MIEDMRVRGFTEKTRNDHVRNVRAFAAFIGRSPDNGDSGGSAPFSDATWAPVSKHRIEPYTWFGYAGRSAGMSRHCVGLGELAMTAFLSRLFRRPRGDAPAWIEVGELQRRLAAGDPVVLVDVRQPEEFTAPPGHLPGAVNVPLADLSGRAGELAGGENRSCWFVKPTADLPGQRQSYLPPAYGMSPSFVAEQTGGTDEGWLSNSWGVSAGRKSQTTEG
jgi:rhodanese-related sulfurtransferase